MNIGNASTASGLSSKMIRYYEAVGLLPQAARRKSNYRDYDESDVNRLIFVRRARDLGFDVEVVRDLLSLWSDHRRSKTEVRAIAIAQVARLKAQAKNLEEMIATLRQLITACKRQRRPECPIISELCSPQRGKLRRAGAKDNAHRFRATRQRGLRG